MDFFTSVEVFHPERSIRLNDSIVSLGSCFAECMGTLLTNYKLDCLVNPFGVLYNPKSIFQALQLLMDTHLKGSCDLSRDDLFLHDGLWRSLLFSSLHAWQDPGETYHRLRESIMQAARKLHSADVLMLTFGTDHYYYHKATACIAANCHRLPTSDFEERVMTLEGIIREGEQVISRLLQAKPDLQLILTVSPYRYAKYGYHKSQLSKARLLLAVEQWTKTFPKNCYYFPAYEIMNDELRDYRFYADDMLHPSKQAVTYIWKRFTETAFDEETKTFMTDWEAIYQGLRHRPLHPKSDSYQSFLKNLVRKIVLLKEKYPNLAVQTETDWIHSKILE